MGVLSMCKNRKAEWVAFFAATISGILTHAFSLVQPLHNYDNILYQPFGYGDGITSGRWFMDIMGKGSWELEMNYNLPVINGIGYLLLIAVSAAFLVNVLGIRNWVSAALTGSLLVTFPTVCATMVFRFTSVYYGVALLLSVLAAWVADRLKLGWLLSAMCIAFALGIYQAYTPFTIGLFILLLMRASLEEGAKLPKLLCRAARYCISLCVGAVLYFAILKILLALYSTAENTIVLNTYQGIDQMGKMSVQELFHQARKAWSIAVRFFVRDYCQLASTPILKLIWFCLTAVIVCMIGRTMVARKIKPLLCVFCLLMGFMFPLAINFVVVMCPDSNIYTMMVYSFVLVSCAPLTLLEVYPKSEKRNYISGIASCLVAGIAFCNAYVTNVNYTALYYSNQQTENYINRLITNISMTEGYSPEMEWVFLGDIQDPLFYNIWDVTVYGGLHCCTAPELLTTYSFDSWIYAYVGYKPPYASAEKLEQFWEYDVVRQMPCWPTQGSIKVIEDAIVVKFQNLE